jgi:glutamine cyclotransferase
MSTERSADSPYRVLRAGGWIVVAQRRHHCRIWVVAVAVAAAACRGTADAPDYAVVRRLPHDTAAYTQGLVYARGRLYESTGLFGRSQVRQVELQTARVEVSVSLPADRFGDGLALLGARLF